MPSLVGYRVFPSLIARIPASTGIGGVGKSGSPAPRSITSSPAARRRFASWEIAIVAEVSRWAMLGDNTSLMGGWLRELVGVEGVGGTRDDTSGRTTRATALSGGGCDRFGLRSLATA